MIYQVVNCMKVIDESKTQAVNEELEKRFKTEREDWNKNLFEVINLIKDVKSITDAQIKQLSFRQIITDKLVEYRILADKRQESYDKLIQKRNDEYENQSAKRMSSTEKKVYLAGDYAALNRQIKLIERQIYFLEESVKTLDNLGFSIRNKIEIINNQLM